MADPDSAAAAPSGATEILGPFTVLSVGNRLSPIEAFNKAHIPHEQQNVLTIRVTLEDNRVDDRAKKLLDRLHETNYRSVGVILYSRKDAR